MLKKVFDKNLTVICDLKHSSLNEVESNGCFRLFYFPALLDSHRGTQIYWRPTVHRLTLQQCRVSLPYPF